MKRNIGSGQFAERQDALFFGGVLVYVYSEEETVLGELDNPDPTEKSDRVCRVFLLHNFRDVDQVGVFFAVKESQNVLSAHCKLGRFGECDYDTVVRSSCCEDLAYATRGIVRCACGQGAVEKNDPISYGIAQSFLDPPLHMVP